MSNSLFDALEQVNQTKISRALDLSIQNKRQYPSIINPSETIISHFHKINQKLIPLQTTSLANF
jgi:hypothetical protein